MSLSIALMALMITYYGHRSWATKRKSGLALVRHHYKRGSHRDIPIERVDISLGLGDRRQAGNGKERYTRW